MKTNKHIYVFFLFLTLLSFNLFSQDPEVITHDDGKPTALGCYQLKWEGLKPYYCVGEPIHITAKLVWVENCEEGLDCSGFYQASLDFNGQLLHHFNSFELEKDETSYGIQLNNKPVGRYQLTLSLTRTCTYTGRTTVESNTVQINIIEPGQRFEYVKYIFRGLKIGNDNCAELLNDREYVESFKICCGATNKIIFISEASKTSTTSDSWSYSFGIKAKGGTTGIFSINSYAKVDRSYNIVNSFKEQLIQQVYDEFELVSPEKGCVIPSFSMIYTWYEKETWLANCNSNADDRLIDVIDVFVPIGPTIRKGCIVPINDNECPDKPIKPEFIISPRLLSNCLTDIKVLFPPGVSTDGFTYEWTSPSGKQYTSKDITAEEYGMFTLVITDRCCNKHVYTVNVCKEKTVSNWIYNSETQQYCRTVKCKGDNPTFNFRIWSEPCDGGEYQECITPEYGDWEFDESDEQCHRKVFLNGKEMPDLEETKTPSVIEDYDEDSGNCIRKYYCSDNTDEDPIFEVEESPEFGEWEYDFNEDEEHCYRDIYCFGSGDPIGDYKDVTDADIEWQFDEYGFYCLGTVYCDNEETDVEIQTDPELENVSIDYSTHTCFSDEIYCNGSLVPSAEYEFEPYEIGEWDKYCNRIIICEAGGEEFVEKGDPIWRIIEEDSPKCEKEGGGNLYAVICNGELTDKTDCFKEDPNFAYKKPSLHSPQEKLFDISLSNNQIKINELLNSKYFDLQLIVFDYLGRALLSKSFDITQNESNININMNLYRKSPNGIGIFYFVLFDKGENIFCKKIQIRM